MSNQQLQTEALMFSFLNSDEFINVLMAKNLDGEQHNLLLSAHLVALCYSTTSVSSGGASVTYSRQISEPVDKELQPKSGIHIYSTRGQLVEESRYSSRARISLNNRLYYTNYGYEFIDFLQNYWKKYAKTLDLDYFIKTDESLRLSDEDKALKFSLHGKKRNSEEGLIHGYQQIINRNKIVKSVVEQFYLEKTLSVDLKKGNNLRRKI